MQSLTVLPASQRFFSCGAWSSRRYHVEQDFHFEALLCSSEETVETECRKWMKGKAAGERVMAFAKKSKKVHIFIQLRDGAMIGCSLEATTALPRGQDAQAPGAQESSAVSQVR